MAKIGSVQESRREVQATAGRINPASGLENTFGQIADQAPLYAAIQEENLGRDSANTSLNLALRARQEKVESARLSSELIKLRNNLGRELLADYDAALPGHQGFFDAQTTKATDAFSVFMEKVPERLRPEFQTEIAVSTETLRNQAFELQVKSENAEFTRSVSELALDISEGMQSGNIADLEDVEAEGVRLLDRLFTDSPLDRASSAALRENLNKSIKAAKFSRLAQEEVLDYMSNGGTVGEVETVGNVVKSSRPVAAGLSAAMVGFLKNVADTESRGEYNVMYGNRYFSDFSDHPNQPAEITAGPHKGDVSTAAGRYMFTYDTWKEAQAALGLPDFSPESQDRAAVWLAKKRYKELTGRDLEVVLSSGHAPSIAAVRQILAPTWEGFKFIDDEDFVAGIAGATGNTSSLLLDPEFEVIPLADRERLMADAMAQANVFQQQTMARQNQAREAAMNELLFGLQAGEKGAADIGKMQAEWNMSFTEVEKAMKLFEERNGQILAAQAMTGKLEDTNYTFDASSEQERDELSQFYAVSGAGDKIAQGDVNYLSEVILPVTAKTGFIPPTIANALQSQVLSLQPGQAEFALEAIYLLQQTNPFAARAFEKETLISAELYNAGKSHIVPDTLMKTIRGNLTQQDQALLEIRDKQMATALTERADEFDPTALAWEISGGKAEITDGLTASALMGEAIPLYRYFFRAGLDHSAAMESTVNLLKTQWGRTEIGGDASYFMKWPPQLAGVKPLNGGYDWINEELRTYFPDETTQLRLIPDHQTERQIAEGKPPSYSLMVRTETGQFAPVTMKDVAGESGNPLVDYSFVRYVAEIPAEAIESQLTTPRTTAALENADAKLRAYRQITGDDTISIDELKIQSRTKDALQQMLNKLNSAKVLPTREVEELKRQLSLDLYSKPPAPRPRAPAGPVPDPTRPIWPPFVERWLAQPPREVPKLESEVIEGNIIQRREELSAENARKAFEAEVAKVRKQQPSLSDEEAAELILVKRLMKEEGLTASQARAKLRAGE